MRVIISLTSQKEVFEALEMKVKALLKKELGYIITL